MGMPLRILVVDDDHRVARGTALILEKSQYATATALTAEEATRAIPEFKPDLVLLDRDLPDVDGMELCRHLKQAPVTADLFVILISGTYTGIEEQVEGLEHGADGYIVRPVSSRELTARINAFVRTLELTRSLREESRRLQEANAALRQKHEMLSRTERIAHVGSWEWDIATDLVRWSDELFRIFQRDTLSAPPSFAEHSNLYVPEDLHMLRQAVERCAADGTPYEIELRAIRADGTIRHCVAHGQPERDEKGRIFRLVGFLHDITDRKRIEEELEETGAILRAAMDNSQAGIAIADAPDGRLRYVNRAGLLIRGETEDKVVEGIDVNNYVESWQIMDLDGKPYKPEEVPLARAVLFGEVCTREFIVRRSATEDVLVWANAAPIRDAAGNVRAGIVVFLDITDRKKAEAERELLQAQLAQAQKMESIGRLAGGVAHDFNNMLSVILGRMEIVLGQIDPTDPLFTDLQEVKKAAERSADLTRQLLAFARKQAVVPKVVDLNETIEGMLKMLRRLIGENINLRWLPGSNLWPVKIDPSQLDQILANLCVNARDAIADVGEVTIETHNTTCDEEYCALHPEFAPGDYVLFAVSDSGCGMDRETMARIFEPFYTTKGIDRGTGLGLATVYGAVRQSHGLISVYSELGRGTTFKIYLPRQVEEEASSRGPQPAVALAEHAHETILLVEDEPAILHMTSTILEKRGYVVLAASSPSEAIRLAESYPRRIDLLLTDVVLPEMNGPDLAERLLSARPGLKCLFMSGYTGDAITHHGILKDGVRFIQKPFSHSELATRIRAILG